MRFSESNLKRALKNLFLKYRKDVFLLEPQLGLGDSLINIGLIKTLSSKNPNYFYYYACLPSSLHSVNWMFRDLPNVYPSPVNSGKEARQLADFYNCKHAYIGGPKLDQRRFDEFFYSQHHVPFETRWSLASIPSGPHAEQLFNQLNPDNSPYILVNATQSGAIKYKLKIENLLHKKVIEVFPATPNIYDWTKLVLNADEIHTIDTSFIHFVENIYALSSRGGLFFHLARSSKTEFTRRLPWQSIFYENGKESL